VSVIARTAGYFADADTTPYGYKDKYTYIMLTEDERVIVNIYVFKSIFKVYLMYANDKKNLK